MSDLSLFYTIGRGVGSFRPLISCIVSAFYGVIEHHLGHLEVKSSITLLGNPKEVMLKNRNSSVCLLSLFLCCLLTAAKLQAQSEIILKNDGSAKTYMMLTAPGSSSTSKYISRLELAPFEQGYTFPSQQVSMSANFEGNLSTMADVSSGIGFSMQDVKPLSGGVLSGSQVRMPLSGGSFQLTRGGQLLLNANIISAEVLANVGAPLTPAATSEPLYPYNTQKFVYYTASFQVTQGSLGSSLCSQGNIIIRHVNPYNCVATGKTCLLSTSSYLHYFNGSLNGFTASIYDITISKKDALCGQAIPTETATPTATRTSTPTNTRTPTPSNTRTATPTQTRSSTPTNTATYTPTRTPTKVITATPTSTFTPSRTATATPTVIITVTSTPTATLTSTPAAPVTVEPLLECVYKENSSECVAIFGYRNNSPSLITVPPGAENFFNPPPSDRKQPVNFVSGRFTNVFSVPFNCSSLTWFLGKVSVTADSNSPACFEKPCTGEDAMTDACLGCSQRDITAAQIAIDSGAFAQKKLINSLAKRLQNSTSDPKIQAFAASAKSKAQKLYMENWQLTWSMPQLMKTCENIVVCINTQNAPTITTYNTTSKLLKDLALSLNKKLAKILKKKADPVVIKKANALHAKNLESSATVPSHSSVCSK